MINLDSLTDFLESIFTKEQLYIDRFKPDVLIVDIDCLTGDRKLTIRATFEEIEFSTISKEPEMDFSLFNFAISDQTEAQKLIENIKRNTSFYAKKNYNNLTSEQKKLADFMSKICERCYSAGWLMNLEYVLWDTLTNGKRKYGQDEISQHDIEELKRLSSACNCWIYFDDINEETKIDFMLWTQKFKQAICQNANILKG